jgi:hypothetical protein
MIGHGPRMTSDQVQTRAAYSVAAPVISGVANPSRAPPCVSPQFTGEAIEDAPSAMWIGVRGQVSSARASVQIWFTKSPAGISLDIAAD